MNTESLSDKWKSFGWEVSEADGHNIIELFNFFEIKSSKPKLLIANTINLIINPLICKICYINSRNIRLFGNVFGGENLLTSMTGMAPYLVPIPFYLYEVLVGVVQALIFTLLVAIYIGLMTNHDEEAH